MTRLQNSQARATRSKAQKQKFIAKARELGVDEDESAFDEKLAAVAKQKPKKDEAPEK